MEPDQPDISSDSGAASGSEVPPITRNGVVIRKMKNKLKRHPEFWLGDTPLNPRDNLLLHCNPANFIDYTKNIGLCYLAKIAHFKRGENVRPEAQTAWTAKNDDICKLMVWKCGGIAFGFPPAVVAAPYPRKYEEYHIKVHVKIMLSTIAILRHKAAWGILSTTPDKIVIFKGPEQFTPSHPWDAMVLRDCIATPEGELQRSKSISAHRWDILLMRIGGDFSYPWVPVSIRNAGPINYLDWRPQRECFPFIPSPRSYR
ncbi:hypothetical protein F4781DRAFT_427539 [Annulohypoxylon bovei var. microspora]|nr:hypothetical protein F4781DRAFT_427539 [Annulohypoxylon bovei var. microspora]